MSSQITDRRAGRSAPRPRQKTTAQCRKLQLGVWAVSTGPARSNSRVVHRTFEKGPAEATELFWAKILQQLHRVAAEDLTVLDLAHDADHIPISF